MHAQPFRFSRLGLADGLSQATIYTITQDSSGFLWVGTQNGVNRYDGQTFHSDWVSEVAGEPSPASYGHVQITYVDASGTLWVGLRGLGLFRFDASREAFLPVPVVSAGTEAAGPQINAIAEWRDSLFLASDVGLLALDRAEPFATLRLRPHAAGTGCGMAATALEAVDDMLWTGTADGCVIRERPGGERTTTRVAPGDAIHAIALSPEGVVLVATESSGFARLRPDGTVIGAGSAAGSAAPTDQGSVVTVSSNGDTWLGTRGGLGWIPLGSSDTTWIGNGTEEEGILPHQAVYSIFEDATGVIWVGTWAGLARLSPFYNALSFIPRPDVPGIGSGGGIVALIPDGPDALLTGSLGGLLAHVSTDGEATPPAIPDAPEFGADIFSLARAPDGTLWVATNGRGIHRRDTDGWRAYRAGSEGRGGAPDDRIAAIHVDRSGTVWAGTMLSGLAAYDADQDRFRTFELSDAALPEPYVWPIREDRGGGLWFAANGPAGGIHYLDPDRVRLDFFDTSGENDEIPNAGRILTLALSGDSVVWFGTQGGGLGRLDRRSRGQRFFTTDDGLPHNSVPGILEDDRGYLWVATNDGLARFDPTTEVFWSFSTASGIQADRFLANAALKSAEGRLYFGGPNGITVIDPGELEPRNHAPKVALTGFVVQGQERAGLNHEVAREGVALDPGENFFSIEFAALDFTEPNLNEYRYRLDDFDTDWVPAGSVGSARYTGVPPGRYRFVVEAKNSEGVWNQEALDLPIRVRPEYYQTLWFRGGMLFLALSLLGAALAYRSRQLAQVRTMRLKIASDLHDDIGANLNAIALKSDLLRRRPERVDATRVTQSLSDIQRLANDTMQKVREMIWVVKSEHDTVESLIARMQDVASTMVRGITEIRFSVDDLPKVQIPMEVRQDAYLGFKEAIQNVIRHSGASEVLVRVAYEAPHLHITVTDDGAGFDPDGVVKGNGLALLEQRAGRNGTRFAIHSEEDRGTTVRITVRVG